MESYVAIRFRKGSVRMLNFPTPWYIWVPYFVFFTSGVSFYLYLRMKKDATTETTGNELYLKETPEYWDSEDETQGYTPKND